MVLVSDRDRTSGDPSEVTSALSLGVGIGALGLASAALLGSVCPACVIAAPALIGYGIHERVQRARTGRSRCDNEETT